MRPEALPASPLGYWHFNALVASEPSAKINPVGLGRTSHEIAEMPGLWADLPADKH